MSVLVPQRLRDIGIITSHCGAWHRGRLNRFHLHRTVHRRAIRPHRVTRWGRRTPWIFCGAFIYGVLLGELNVRSVPVIIGLVYVLALIGLNMVQAPIYARISDRTDIACHRVRLSAQGSVIGRASVRWSAPR